MPTKRGTRWRAMVWDQSKGYMKSIGTYDTKREAKDAEADYRKRTIATSRETVDSFAERWTTDYPRPRESTNLHYDDVVKRFAAEFKDIRIGDLDRPAARKWAISHRHMLGPVRAMFGDAMRDGLIPSNPFAELRLPGSKGRKEIRALTEPELKALAGLALEMGLGDYGSHYQAMILFAGYVGCRPGELFALRRSDVGAGTCHIERALERKTKVVGLTKNGKSRTVVVPPVAMEAVEALPATLSGLLFESPGGKMWSTTSHHDYWSRLRILARRPELDFYELRHCAATMLVERGAQPWEVAQQLGHTDGGQLVSELYGHPRDEVARARMAQLWETTPLRKVESV